jgi:hypothetical protein
MLNKFQIEHTNQYVNSFQDLVDTAYQGETNAICWKRELLGNFEEIVQKITVHENIQEIEPAALLALRLSEEGQLARQIILQDIVLLEAYGAAPVLNIIKCYERDDDNLVFPTDVYSFHVDRAPIATDTFLCTYHGAASDILPNAQAVQKILLPEMRAELEKLATAAGEPFEAFVKDNSFDLHYQALPQASPMNLGLGHLWKLAVDHPTSRTLPCIHRAPKETDEKYRLLLIC